MIIFLKTNFKFYLTTVIAFNIVRLVFTQTAEKDPNSSCQNLNNNENIISVSAIAFSEDYSKQKSYAEPIDYVEIRSTRNLFIYCNSTRPIQWIYEGQGIPSRVREFSSRDNKNCTSSILKFYSKDFSRTQDSAKHSGLYICREIGQKNGSQILNEKSVYVFFAVNAKSTLLNAGRKSKEAGKIILDKKLGKKLTIPCVTSNPLANILLFKNNSKGNFEEIKNFTFDKKIGFTISLNSSNIKDAFGNYKCKLGKNYNLNNVIQPPALRDFKVNPEASVVYTSGILNLTCESDKSVLIKEVEAWLTSYSYYDEESEEQDSNEYFDDIIEEITEATIMDKFIANHIDEKPVQGSHGSFQCIRESDEKVLHNWYYLIIDKETDEESGLTNNRGKGYFQCKTKAASRGKLSFINCETPSECQINRICLERSDSCQGYFKFSRIGCAKTIKKCNKLHYGNDTGIVRCKGEGVDEIKEFTNEFDFQYGHNRSLEESVKLIIPEEKVLYAGDQLFVAVYYSRFHFVDGIRWGIGFNNGTFIDFDPKFYKNNVHNGGIYSSPAIESVTIQNLPLNTTSCVCKLPKRNSLEYHTISIPIIVIDPDENKEEEEEENEEENEIETTTTTITIIDLPQEKEEEVEQPEIPIKEIKVELVTEELSEKINKTEPFNCTLNGAVTLGNITWVMDGTEVELEFDENESDLMNSNVNYNLFIAEIKRASENKSDCVVETEKSKKSE